MKDPAQLRASLALFMGTENVYHHSLVRNFFYTDGVRHFAREAGGGAYWFLDILATEPSIKRLVDAEGFASVRLVVSGKSALLTVDDGNGSPPAYRQSIGYTDCPEGEWNLYIEPTEVGNKAGVMCMLPNER